MGLIDDIKKNVGIISVKKMQKVVKTYLQMSRHVLL